MLSAVLRQELAGDGIAVSLLLPSITAPEFGDGAPPDPRCCDPAHNDTMQVGHPRQ
jgi:short-subunit dehydrogenase